MKLLNPNMEPKIIKNQEDYENAIKSLEMIGDIPGFEDDSKLLEKFELFTKLINDFEKESFQIEEGNPIEIIKLRMGYLGLKQKDLEPYIGSKGTVSDVLNKRRGLSKSMIRKLSSALNLDQEILNVKYELSNNKEVVRSLPQFDFQFKPTTVLVIKTFKSEIQRRGMLLNVCQ